MNQYRVGCRDIVFESPAGVIDKGESPEQAMLRELREECGIAEESVEVITKIGSYYHGSVTTINSAAKCCVAAIEEIRMIMPRHKKGQQAK